VDQSVDKQRVASSLRAREVAIAIKIRFLWAAPKLPKARNVKPALSEVSTWPRRLRTPWPRWRQRRRKLRAHRPLPRRTGSCSPSQSGGGASVTPPTRPSKPCSSPPPLRRRRPWSPSSSAWTWGCSAASAFPIGLPPAARLSGFLTSTAPSSCRYCIKILKSQSPQGSAPANNVSETKGKCVIYIGIGYLFNLLYVARFRWTLHLWSTGTTAVVVLILGEKSIVNAVLWTESVKPSCMFQTMEQMTILSALRLWIECAFSCYYRRCFFCHVLDALGSFNPVPMFTISMIYYFWYR
jgi:hypothetical protein